MKECVLINCSDILMRNKMRQRIQSIHSDNNRLEINIMGNLLLLYFLNKLAKLSSGVLIDDLHSPWCWQLNQLGIDAGKYYDINRQFLADPAFKTKTKTESSINMMPFINIQHNMSDYYYIIRRYKQKTATPSEYIKLL